MHKTDFTGAPATQPWLQRERLLGVWPRVLEFIYALQQSIKQTSQQVYGNGRMIYAQLRGHPFFPTLPGQHPSLHSIHSGWCVFTRLMVIRPVGRRLFGGGENSSRGEGKKRMDCRLEPGEQGGRCFIQRAQHVGMP